tara:strand:- start:74 stop:559 length:486 start_codon:yes stop_codon:yes gene_type:complete
MNRYRNKINVGPIKYAKNQTRKPRIRKDGTFVYAYKYNAIDSSKLKDTYDGLHFWSRTYKNDLDRYSYYVEKTIYDALQTFNIDPFPLGPESKEGHFITTYLLSTDTATRMYSDWHKEESVEEYLNKTTFQKRAKSFYNQYKDYSHGMTTKEYVKRLRTNK